MKKLKRSFNGSYELELKNTDIVQERLSLRKDNDKKRATVATTVIVGIVTVSFVQT
jgi:hypothetical protein